MSKVIVKKDEHKVLRNNIILSIESEIIKQHNEFNNKTNEQTSFAPNLEIIGDTNNDAVDNPKYTNEPNNACSL